MSLWPYCVGGLFLQTGSYFLRNIFLIIQLSIQQSGEHSFLAQFREYTCFFFKC